MDLDMNVDAKMDWQIMENVYQSIYQGKIAREDYPNSEQTRKLIERATRKEKRRDKRKEYLEARKEFFCKNFPTLVIGTVNGNQLKIFGKKGKTLATMIKANTFSIFGRRYLCISKNNWRYTLQKIVKKKKCKYCGRSNHVSEDCFHKKDKKRQRCILCKGIKLTENEDKKVEIKQLKNEITELLKSMTEMMAFFQAYTINSGAKHEEEQISFVDEIFTPTKRYLKQDKL
ncbi:hypothetical protein RFI_00393, partial [Reticulomyxa filosa]